MNHSLELKSDFQRNLEKHYSKQHVDAALEKFLEDHYSAVINEAASYFRLWLDDIKDNCKSPAKVDRISFLNSFDLYDLALKLLCNACYVTKPQLFTSVTAQGAGILGFSDKSEAIQTVAELYAVLAHTNAIQIYKPDMNASMQMLSNIQLSEELITDMGNTHFVPPMVHPPKELITNSDSPYFTIRDKLILGKGNSHNSCISLDVLNKLNSVQLTLNTQFLSSVEEVPTKEWETPEQQENWDTFKAQSYELYSLVASQYGNKFYLTNSVDKRGRIYARGYHITTQGTSFKKSMVDFSNQEPVTGLEHLNP